MERIKDRVDGESSIRWLAEGELGARTTPCGVGCLLEMLLLDRTVVGRMMDIHGENERSQTNGAPAT